MTVTVVRDPYAKTWTLSTAVADGAGAAVDDAADGSMLRPSSRGRLDGVEDGRRLADDGPATGGVDGGKSAIAVITPVLADA